MAKISTSILAIVIPFLILQLVSSNSDTFGEYNLRRIQADEEAGLGVMNKNHIRKRINSFRHGKWRRMKIFFDLTNINRQNPKRQKFYEEVFRITGNWWQQAVWINDSKMAATKFLKEASRQEVIPKFKLPKGQNLESYDLYMDVHMTKEEGGTLAWAGPLEKHPISQRPITGECAVAWFGDKNFMESGENAVNVAVDTIIHEFGHAMAFIAFQDFHKHYVSYNNSWKSWQWTGRLARHEATKYYGCTADKMKGLRLQSMSKTEAGAHWSEAIFQDELLTPVGDGNPEKMSPMSFGLVEDTFWYMSNYAMTENYSYRKAVPEHCAQTKVCPQKLACQKGNDMFVTNDYRAVGYCEKNTETGCYEENKYANQDVSKPKDWDADEPIALFGGSFGPNSYVVKGSFLRFDEKI